MKHLLRRTLQPFCQCWAKKQHAQASAANSYGVQESDATTDAMKYFRLAHNNSSYRLLRDK